MQHSLRLRDNLISEKQLNEPQIYANKLLGTRVNTKEKITLKMIDGKLTKVIRSTQNGEILRTVRAGSEDRGKQSGSKQYDTLMRNTDTELARVPRPKIRKFNIGGSRSGSIHEESGRKSMNLDLQDIIQINKEFKEREAKKQQLKEQLRELQKAKDHAQMEE